MQILVTDDFDNHSPYMSLNVMGIGIHHIVQALVALNVGTTVPLLLLPLVDILQSVLATSCIDAQDTEPFTGVHSCLLVLQYGQVPRGVRIFVSSERHGAWRFLSGFSQFICVLHQRWNGGIRHCHFL